MSEFKVTGLDEASALFGVLTKAAEKGIDSARKAGLTKALDYTLYGSTKTVSPSKISNRSAIGYASKALNIPKEHLYYRAFVKSIKRNKPYAAAMLRGNAINMMDLLVDKADLKSYYGYKTRKSGAVGKANKLQKTRIANKAAYKAKQSMKGMTLRVAGRTFRNALIENGQLRGSSAYWDRYYQDKLGAQKFKLSQIGNPFFLMTKKSATQENPYPVKVEKIKRGEVMKALTSAASLATKESVGFIQKIQTTEIHKKLNKLGFKLI